MSEHDTSAPAHRLTTPTKRRRDTSPTAILQRTVHRLRQRVAVCQDSNRKLRDAAAGAVVDLAEHAHRADGLPMSDAKQLAAELRTVAANLRATLADVAGGAA